jgi:hypothetical protein
MVDAVNITALPMVKDATNAGPQRRFRKKRKARRSVRSPAKLPERHSGLDAAAYTAAIALAGAQSGYQSAA